MRVGDGQGHVYIADSLNAAIRKIDIATGTVTTIAGGPDKAGVLDGPIATARLWQPIQLTIDTTNNILYFIDGSAIRKIDLVAGTVSTLAGNVTVSGNTNAMERGGALQEPGRHRVRRHREPLRRRHRRTTFIRQVQIGNGNVTTLAGSGTYGTMNNTGTLAQFTNVGGLAYDGGNLYVADSQSEQIRQIVVSSTVVTTLAGSTQGYLDMPGTAAKFFTPTSVVADHAGNLYVSDASNYRIRKIVISGAVVSTIAGDGTQGYANGTGTAAEFAALQQITLEGGNLYVTDYFSDTIRQITLPGAVVTDFAGYNGIGGKMNGAAAATATFFGPSGFAQVGGKITIADEYNYVLRQLDTSSMMVSTFTGAGTKGTMDGDAMTAQFFSPTAGRRRRRRWLLRRRHIRVRDSSRRRRRQRHDAVRHGRDRLPRRQRQRLRSSAS